MSSRLNKILYNYDVFYTADSITALEPYMVGSRIHPNTTVIVSDTPETINSISINPDRTDKFFPKQQDTLFWSIFIANYGLKEFYNVDRYKNREIDEKCKIIEYMKNLSKMDVNLTKCYMQEVMGSLMVDNKTTLFMVNALCIYYKMNFLFVSDNTYLEFDLKKLLVCTDSSEIPIGIMYKNGNKYAVDLYVTTEKIQIIQDTKIRLEKYDRPLLGISTYKITDLETMLVKLHLSENTTKKPTKQELYVIIWKNCLGFAT